MSNKYFADISSNNGSFNAAEYASAGHVAISIKATENTGYTNPFYAEWVRAAHRHGLAVFHYHFGRPENGNARGQAEHFWHTVSPHFRRPGDYVVLDLETGEPHHGADWGREYDDALRRISGTHPILYTYLSYFRTGAPSITSGSVWLAAYGSHQPPGNLGRKLRLWSWQATDGSGFGPRGMPQRFAGIPGHCDGSILNSKTLRELTKRRR